MIKRFLYALGFLAISSTASFAACTAGQPPAGTVCAAPAGTAGTSNFRLLADGHIPSGINAAKIGGGSVSNAEYDLLNGITSFGQSIIDDANEAAFKATVNLEIGVDVQAFDSDLSTWAGLTPSANAQSLVTAANYAAMRALLDLEAGTDFYSIAAADAAFQPLDADLTSWSGVTRASGFDTFVATPSSANLAGLVTNETGSGPLVFATDPDISISATTEGNIETAIDTLANLTSIQGQSFTMGAYAPTLLNTANEAGFKSATNLESGIDVQAWDAELDSLSSDAFSRATAATASWIRLLEDTDNGTNYIEFISPTAIGTNRQCLLVDGAAPIPDSCVGDGVDAGAGGGINAVVEDTSPQLGGNLDLNTFLVGAASAADLTKLSEITATSAELNFVDGVTSAIQTQIDGKQPLDADLTSWAGVTRASGFDTFVATPSSTNLRALLTDESGTGVAYFQGGDLGTPSAGVLTNATGLPLSSVVDSTSEALGVGSLELGAASDTTFARVSAGTASIEGQNILTAATGQPLDADLTSIAALTTTAAGRSVLTVADPGGHRALGWDDTGNAIVTKTLGGGLTTDADSIDCGVATDSAQGCAEFATTAEAAAQTVTDRIVTPAGLAFKPESLCVAASDETTDLTTGTAKATFRMPYAFTLTNVRASVNDAAAGTLITVDINEGGSTIMTTNKLTIDIAELTSTTAATAVGITDTSLADDAEMKIDIDGVGTTAKGLKVCLIGHQ